LLSQDGPVACPVTVNVQSGCDAPGQLILYVPGWTVSEKPPESPGVRFSCSPRTWALSELRSSASDTEPAPELVTSNSTGPAGTLAGLGSQPSDVRLILTVLDLSSLAAAAPVDPFAPEPEPELEHPDATSARLATTIAAAAPRRLARVPSLLTLGDSSRSVEQRLTVIKTGTQGVRGRAPRYCWAD
jgi:hypothetical protein